MCAGVDRAAEVRLEFEPEPSGDRGRHLVGVHEHDGLPAGGERSRQRHGHLGDTTAARAGDHDQRPQTPVARGARVGNGVGAGTDRAGRRDVEVGERVDELRHRRVPGDRGVHAEGEEVILARRFLGIEDTERPADHGRGPRATKPSVSAGQRSLTTSASYSSSSATAGSTTT